MSDIDYKLLLKKYITHIFDEESVSYICKYMPTWGDVKFTKREEEILLELDREIKDGR